jgi:uncharacterized protein YbbK (DUF523 family)
MIVVSACLVGINTAYSGSNFENEKVKQMVAEGKAIPICPEQLGGLPTPRDLQEIQGGTGKDVWEGKARIMTIKGGDTTEAFLNGAQAALKIAQLVKAEEAILKAGSPSCGCGWIWDGTFTRTSRPGDGVTTVLLKENGIPTRTEEDL